MKKKRRQRLPAGDFETTIECLSHDCRGIARVDGKATFIQGALTDEIVTFQYKSRKQDFDEGALSQVLNASEKRVQPKCQHYAICGGCSLQHLDHQAQIKEKETILLNLLERQGNVTPQQILPPITVHPWHYRNKARLSVKYVEKKQSTLVGFRERHNPRFITDISHCPILHEKVDNDIVSIRKLLDDLNDKKYIAQIEVAAGDEETALIIRNLSALSEADEQKIRNFADEHQYLIFLQPGNEQTVYLFHPQHRSDEFLHYELPQFALRLKFHPTDFTQSNWAVNRKMIEQALHLISPQEKDEILDLFCGLGNFSLPLARQCAKVIGVEGTEAMVERARMNADENQLKNTEFYAANLDDPEQIQQFYRFSCNKILIDPPRSGAFEIVKLINQWKPERIVYVSCNPATLARDCNILVNQHGYVLRSVGMVDMFPHTTHIESMALFVREQ